MILETAAILGLGMGALNYSEARKAQKKAEAHAKAVIAERRAAKKAALKAVRQSYRELDEDSSRALNQALKEGGAALYKSVGGTTGANFARGMFRQFGAAQRQARKEESRAIADIESRTTLEMNDFAGLAAGAGALAEMRNDLIKQGLGALALFDKSSRVISPLFLITAKCNGVWPLFVLALMCAPCVSNRRTISGWRMSTA